MPARNGDSFPDIRVINSEAYRSAAHPYARGEDASLVVTSVVAMREASTKFRRIAGHKDMPKLVHAPRAHETVESQEGVA